MPDSDAVANSEPDAFKAKAAKPDWCAFRKRDEEPPKPQRTAWKSVTVAWKT